MTKLKHTCINCKACDEEDRTTLREMNMPGRFRDELLYGPFYTFVPKIDFVDILQAYMNDEITMRDINEYVTIINDEIEAFTELLESAMEQRAELSRFDHSQEIDLGGC